MIAKVTPSTDITIPEMYRSLGPGGPPLFPRHWSQWSTAFDGETWLLTPLFTDEEVAKVAGGPNSFAKVIFSFLDYRANPGPRTEMPRPMFELLRVYLVHWLYAPGWVDSCRARFKLKPLELGELIEPRVASIPDVQTPTELVQFIESMMVDGLDPISPADISDYDTNPVQIAR